MKIAYLNCASGASGDMMLAAFIDAGVSSRELTALLRTGLRTRAMDIRVRNVERNGLPAKNISVMGERAFRSPDEMKEIIGRGKLPAKVKESGLRILDRLVRAEARVHDVPARKVHFHELNSLDTMVDIVGTCLCIEMLEIDEIYSSPVNIGFPAPATMEIVKERSIPVYTRQVQAELLTPTGAALLSQIVIAFGDMPLLAVEASGFGAGTKEFASLPNMLNLTVGSISPSYYARDMVVVLETNIDDMDPRIYPFVMEKLLAAGAKDVWLTQTLMKKGRPGIVLSVITAPEDEKKMTDILFEETTTLGIRREMKSRHVLRRDYGTDRKTAYLSRGKTKIKSEFEIARQKARETGKPLKTLII